MVGIVFLHDLWELWHKAFQISHPPIFTFKKGLPLSVVQKVVSQFTCQLQAEAMCVWTHCDVNQQQSQAHKPSSVHPTCFEGNSVKDFSLIKIHQAM